MGMWLFQEWMLTHSCRANNRPSKVNAPTKTTGCKNGGMVRPLIVVNKFSGEPCTFYANYGPGVSGTGGKQLACGGSFRRVRYTDGRKIMLLGSFLIDEDESKRVLLVPCFRGGGSHLTLLLGYFRSDDLHTWSYIAVGYLSALKNRDLEVIISGFTIDGCVAPVTGQNTEHDGGLPTAGTRGRLEKRADLLRILLEFRVVYQQKTKRVHCRHISSVGCLT